MGRKILKLHSYAEMLKIQCVCLPDSREDSLICSHVFMAELTYNYAAKTWITFSQLHYNVVHIRTSEVCHYSIISTLHVVLWLLIYESIWNLTLRLFYQLLIIHYTCDKCCNNIIYVQLSQTLQESLRLLTAQPFRFAH